MTPDGWDRVSFEELATFRNGLNFTKSDKGESIKIVGVGDFKDHSELKTLDGLEKISVANDVKSNDLIESGDLLYVRSNGNKDLIGRCLFFPNVEGKLSFSGFTIRGRTKSGRVLPKFLAILSRSEIVKQQFSRNGGGTNISNLSQQILNDVVVPLPPIVEQREIAKILSTWDKAISTTERLIDNSKQQKKALMQQLLTGKKRLLDDSGKPFEGEWEEVKLGELGTTFTSLTGKTKSDFGSGKLYVPYINIFKNASVDINQLERVNLSDNERQNEVKFGDIFFTTSSETPEEVGMSSVMLDMPNEAVYLNSFCFGFRLHSFEQATPIFMKHVLRSSSVRRSISILAQGATRYNLSKTQLLKVIIPLPQKAEQQKIADVLNNADKEIELLEQQLADLKQEKKALMQQLLTGKRRVKVDDEAVA